MGGFPRSPVSGAGMAAVFAAAFFLLPTQVIAEPVNATDPPSAVGEAQVPDLDAGRSADEAVAPVAAIGASALDAQVECLARNIYWEAGGEPEVGKVAVAAVTLNRVADRRFPKDVCGVVAQGSASKGRCQFTWACDGRRHVTPSGSRWREARAIAHRVLHIGYDDPTNGALFFHGVRERTRWNHIRSMVAQIGNHMFYR
jgi:spore germination cell wall hydrolase CwlJ-like protein